jgi:hypothetical protein
MSDHLPSDEKTLPCAQCGSQPIGSLDVGGTRARMTIQGTVYTCFGDDCAMRGEVCQGDSAARASWNAAQREYKANHEADEAAFHQRLP